MIGRRPADENEASKEPGQSPSARASGVHRMFDAFRTRGTELEITGKTPFFLDDPETVWCVLAGQIDVYVTAREGALQTGGRDHLFTMEAGEALFGVEPGFFGASMGLLAGGIPGTRVLRISRSLFLERTDDEWIAFAASLADIFLEGLGRGIVKDIVPLPRIRQGIVAGRTELAPNKPAGSESLLWGEIEEGRALFVGTEDLARGGGFFALPPNCWIVPLEQCIVRTLPTDELLRRGEFAAVFDAFCEMIFSSLAMNARLRAADDLGALRQMQMSSKRALSSALATLSDALSGKRRKEAVSPEDSPLRRAFATVASFLGRKIASQKGEGDLAPERSGGGESLRDLARASNLQLRHVTLAGPWWLSDGAPLIGFVQNHEEKESASRDGIGKGAPVALLPTGRGYRIVDGEGERPVDERIAATLSPDALHVYRPLPGSPLGGMDLLRFGLAGAKRDLGFVVLISVGLALLGMISPEVNRQIFGEVIPQAERGRMLQLFAILVSVAVSSGLLHLANGTAFLRTESVMDHDVSAGLWDRILRLPVGFFRKTTSGDLANRALGLFMLRETASRTVKTMLVQSIFLFFFLAQSFWYDWRLALVGLGCLLVPAVLMVAVNVVQLGFQRKMIALQNRLTALTFQIMTGISKIRVAGAEERSFARWAELFSGQRTLGTKARKLEVVLNTAMSIFPLAVSIAILFALVRWSAADVSYETGRFMAFWSAFAALQGAFLQMVTSVTMTMNMLPLVENLAPILQAEPETGDLKTDPGEITGRIDLEQVVFRYLKDGPPVLKGLDLHIEPGEFVAVVGPSGAGKSTLIRLLLGFDQPESGGIFYDNKDIAELDLGKLRRQIGVVLQSGGLLSGDIASNVRCSRNLTVEQIEDALRTAGMEEDIAAMPMGIHTVITDGANTVSGGQKQRLLIARSVAGKPRVLIFDEATSALDNRTQAMISRSLENIQATRIVVAHRLSTVIGADRICVLEDGRLVEEGKYDELMAKDGLFAELVRRQTV